MISETVLAVVVLVEVVFCLVTLGAATVNAVWHRAEHRRALARLPAGRLALAAFVAGTKTQDELVADLKRLPLRLRSQLLGDLAPSLRGSERERLGQAAEALGLVARAERLTASRFWRRRLRGAHLLSLYGGGDRLRALLADPSPLVRAQALEYAGDAGDVELARTLLAALDDPSPLCRYTAKDALLRSGAAAVAVLAEATPEQFSPQALAAVLEVAAARPDARYAGPAARMAAAASPSVRSGAATLLGALGGDAPTDLLESLLDDPEPEVRAAAAAALGHLGHWPAAPAVAPLLRDQAFAVRRAAGDALGRFGGPGLVMLRRYTNDGDRFAADMARHTLELVELHGQRSGLVQP